MDKPIIEVQNLSKLYRLGDIGASTLRESVERAWLRWRGGKNGGNSAPRKGRLDSARTGPEPDTFWALKDVSFAIRPGEIVGIIGHNGAGKSTLLKILSRITEPTAGRAILRGRVGSLLEVGTGFHPELSGRDNIYLNGAMLGMKKHEIDRKFDEIVAFSEIEDFVDTPVKRYSSGMYVRLAFAVAAHLEPEILLVDEVLAVGDAAFQKKCLEKMDDVAKHGRTVLLVSHNMSAIVSLCRRVICFHASRLAADGPTGSVLEGYLKETTAESAVPLDQRADRIGDGTTIFTSLKIESTSGNDVIYSSSRLKITLGYRGARPLRDAQFSIWVHDYMNTGIFALDSDNASPLPAELPAEGTVTCITEPINLTAGRCFVELELFKGGALVDHIQRAGSFDVEADHFHTRGKIPQRDWVLGLLQHRWETTT